MLSVSEAEGGPLCEGRDSLGGVQRLLFHGATASVSSPAGPPHWLLSEASSSSNPPLLRRFWGILHLKLSFQKKMRFEQGLTPPAFMLSLS